MGYAHVQGTGATSGGTSQSTLAATYGSSVTAGNLLVASLQTCQSQGGGIATATHSSLVDTKGNTWKKIAEQVFDTNSGYGTLLSIWCSLATSGGTSNQVTMTTSLAGFNTMSIDEYSYSGTPTIEGIAAYLQQPTGTGVAVPSGPLPVAGSSQLIYGVFEQIDNGAAWSAASGTTARYVVDRNPSSSIGHATGEKIDPGGTTATLGFSVASGTPHIQNLAVAFGTLGTGTFPRVQGTAWSSFTATSSAKALTLPFSVSVGDLIVVGVSTQQSGSSTPTVTVSDSGSNTWTQAKHTVFQTGTPYTLLDTWYTLATTGGTITVTVTPAASAFLAITIDHYRPSAGAVVGSTGSAHNTNTTPDPGSLTVSGDALLYGLAGYSSNATGAWTPGSAVVPRYTAPYWPSENIGFAAGDKAITATTATIDWTSPNPNPGSWLATDVAFGPSALPSSGSATVTEGGDTLASSIRSFDPGALAVTEGADTLAATGSFKATAASAVIEGADTLAATAAFKATAGSGVTEGADTLAGVAGVRTLAGFAATESGDTLAAAAGFKASAALNRIEDGDTLEGVVSISWAKGSLTVTEDGDTLAATARAYVPGSLGITEQGDTLAATSRAYVPGGLAALEQGDTLAGAAIASVPGSLNVTEGNDTLSGHPRAIPSPGTFVDPDMCTPLPVMF